MILWTLTGCGAPAYPPPETLDPPIEQESPPEPAPAGPPMQGPRTTGLQKINFTIQVGAFSTIQRASRFADHLEAMGLDAFYFIDTDGLYKVRFERFSAKQEALRRAMDLKKAGVIDVFYVVRPGRDNQETDSGAIMQNDLVTTARRFLGIAYQWGGASPAKGFDCSGLAMTVYRLNGLDLPRSAFSQYQSGVPVSGDNIAPGDLVFFDINGNHRVSHVGIYSGQGTFIHAPRRGKSIRVSSLSSAYFQKRYKGARRYY